MTDSKIRVGDIFLCKKMSESYKAGIVTEIGDGSYRTCKVVSDTKHVQHISAEGLRTLEAYERIGHIDLDGLYREICKQAVVGRKKAQITEHEMVCDGFTIAWTKDDDGHPISASLCYSAEELNIIYQVWQHGKRESGDEQYMRRALADQLEEVVECLRG